MHAAPASARATGGPPEQLGEQLPRRNPFGERVPVAAVRAEDDVFGLQMSAHSHRDRLFADIRVAGPMHEPALMRLGELFLALPDHLHVAEQFETGLLVEPRCGCR